MATLSEAGIVTNQFPKKLVPGEYFFIDSLVQEGKYGEEAVFTDASGVEWKTTAKAIVGGAKSDNELGLKRAIERVAEKEGALTVTITEEQTESGNTKLMANYF